MPIPDPDVPEPTLQELYVRGLERIEALAMRLLRSEFRSEQDIRKIQEDLLDLLVEFQVSTRRIRVQKDALRGTIALTARARRGEWKERLISLQEQLSNADRSIEVLRHLHALGKRVGDAFAWVLLAGHEQHVLPLAQNEPTGSVPEGASLQGVLAIAQTLANQGAGFPLLHDVTNVLRVGDITFVRPDAVPLTVEIKTRDYGAVDGLHTVRIDVHAIDVPRFLSIDRGPAVASSSENAPKGKDKATARKLPEPDSGLARQLRRMRKAHLLQTAQNGRIIHLPDGEVPALSVSIQDAVEHWDVVQQLVEEATETGYASRAVDGAFLYVAGRPSSQTIPRDMPRERALDLSFLGDLEGDLVRSGIFFPNPEDNYLWFRTSMEHLTGDIPVQIRPLFLYSLPAERISDLLWGRLILIVFVNLGRLVEAAKRLGIAARLPHNEEEFHRWLIPMSKTVTGPTGASVMVELHADHLGARIVYEFLSLEGFSNYLSAMVASLEAEIGHVLNDV